MTIEEGFQELVALGAIDFIGSSELEAARLVFFMGAGWMLREFPAAAKGLSAPMGEELYAKLLSEVDESLKD